MKQINSIHCNGRLAFKRVKGEPADAPPKDCQLPERGQTILWEQMAQKATNHYKTPYFQILVSDMHQNFYRK